MPPPARCSVAPFGQQAAKAEGSVDRGQERDRDVGQLEARRRPGRIRRASGNVSGVTSIVGDCLRRHLVTVTVELRRRLGSLAQVCARRNGGLCGGVN
jgi:hypothetical protein